MNARPTLSGAHLLGIGLLSAGLLIAGFSQSVHAGKVCFGKTITNSSHSAEKARAALATKVSSEINNIQARGGSGRQYTTQCVFNSGRTTCSVDIILCPS